MTIDDMRKKFNNFWKEIEKDITTAAEQVFHRKFIITPQVLKEISIQNHWQNATFPLIVVRFGIRKTHEFQHVFFCEPEVGLKLFGWMIEAQQDSTLTEEHLEGIKEAVSQIWGQLQPKISGGSDVQLTGLTVTKIDSATEANIISREGVITKYQIVTDKKDKFILYHYIWFVESSNTVDGYSETKSSEEMAYQSAHPIDFQEINGSPQPNREVRNIDMLMDVELDVYVELGRKMITIRDVLKLGKGSIIELDKAAGEPLGVFINGRKFAEGEVVVVDDQFGIRLTQLVNPKERIKSLS